MSNQSISSTMSPDRPKVSIVLPVYNAGHYLHKCLQSLIGQSLKEIEIIVVLDCPTDGSDRTAKEYALQDRRIRIIENEKNLRVGLSRNKGIEAATGEYIGFCDHDDYVTPDMFERMYLTAKEHEADIVVCDVDYINLSNGHIRSLHLPCDSGKALKEKLHHAVLSVSPLFGSTVWNVLLKKELLNQHDLRFGDNTIITSDDSLFLSKVFFFTDKVFHCDTQECPYKHHVGLSSTGLTYSWLNIPLIINYTTDLWSFLKGTKLTREQSLSIAEGRVRQLYTGFRKELHFKGWIHACRQTRQAARNLSVHAMLRPLFSTPGGLKYALRTLPPTKLLFACFVYL